MKIEREIIDRSKTGRRDGLRTNAAAHIDDTHYRNNKTRPDLTTHHHHHLT